MYRVGSTKQQRSSEIYDSSMTIYKEPSRHNWKWSGQWGKREMSKRLPSQTDTVETRFIVLTRISTCITPLTRSISGCVQSVYSTLTRGSLSMAYIPHRGSLISRSEWRFKVHDHSDKRKICLLHITADKSRELFIVQKKREVKVWCLQKTAFPMMGVIQIYILLANTTWCTKKHFKGQQ